MGFLRVTIALYPIRRAAIACASLDLFEQPHGDFKNQQAA
jgi:hypothetical protein